MAAHRDADGQTVLLFQDPDLVLTF